MVVQLHLNSWVKTDWAGPTNLCYYKTWSIDRMYLLPQLHASESSNMLHCIVRKAPSKQQLCEDYRISMERY